MQADATAAAEVAALTSLLAANVTALKHLQEEATSTATERTATLVDSVKTEIMSDVNELDADLGKVSATLYGRAGRSAGDEASEKGLLDLSTEANALLEKIKAAVEANTLPSARISTFQGCDPSCANGDVGYYAIGRDFIPVADVYQCAFKTEEAKPKEYVTKGSASSPYSLKCPLPTLSAVQLPGKTYKLALKITEGSSVAVPYLGKDVDRLVVTMST